MIDEKKLIERIRNRQAVFRNHEEGFSELSNVLSMIEHAPKVGEWIPCSEKLPPIDMSYPNAKDYLVYYEHGYYDVASYSNINRFWHVYTTEPYWNCAQYCKVVAWQPLPEPYKENNND